MSRLNRRKQPKITSRESQWWRDEFEDSRAEKIMGVVSQLWADASPFRTGMQRWGELYANDPWLSTQLGFSPRPQRRAALTARPAPLALNGVKAVSDTFVAMVTANQLKVSAVTSGGDWELQQKAKSIENFIDGVFYENTFKRLTTQLEYDVVKFGTGCLLVADESPFRKRITLERVLPSEVLVNADDARTGKPQCLYRVRPIARIRLQEMYPDFANELETGGEDFGVNVYQNVLVPSDDYVAVVEAWRLPPMEDTPGRHSIVCGRVTLVDEEWTRPTHPIKFLYRQQPSDGIWGTSLAQELSGLQLAVNKLLRDNARARSLSVGHYMVEASSEINTGQINDRIGGFIKYRGTPPQYIAPPPVNEQNIQELQNHWEKMFETIGVSQSAAQSQKPAGLNSGKALLVYADIQSQRFKPSLEELEHFTLEVGREIIAVAREMDESFYVRAAGKTEMQAVRWADAGGLDDSEFVLKLYPTNALVDDPAARIQQVQDMMTAGIVDAKAGRRLLDMPDINEFEDYENANYNLTMKILHRIFDGEDFVGPEPFMDLGTNGQDGEAIRLMQLGYLKGKLDGVPSPRLQLVSRWISAARGIRDQSSPSPGLPPAPGPPPGGPPPTGGPLAMGLPPPRPTNTI